MADASNWFRVTSNNPCPICGKPDNCTISRDEGWVWCGRVSRGSIRENAGGQHLHQIGDPRDNPRRVDSSQPPPTLPVSAPTEPTGERRSTKFRNRCVVSFISGSEKRNELSLQLGVSVEAITRLRVGWNAFDCTWDFPERDADGQIIGINRRYRNGDKKRVKGGQAGLTYAKDWQMDPGPILLVEGGSDVAAALTMRICAIGRPSNNGGVALLADLLDQTDAGRQIVVIGERDEKPDGRWPGKEGAIGTATKLAEILDRSISWSLPPDNAKDMRAWLNAAPAVQTDRLASLFLDGLNIASVEPPPTFELKPLVGPAVSLHEWRERMLRERFESLDRPGYYLDSSTTGAGKSTIDFTVLLKALNAESA
jgi:hypothetical protein